MTPGWIAFTILLAFIAGSATTLLWGQWMVRRNPEKFGKKPKKYRA